MPCSKCSEATLIETEGDARMARTRGRQLQRAGRHFVTKQLDVVIPQGRRHSSLFSRTSCPSPPAPSCEPRRIGWAGGRRRLSVVSPWMSQMGSLVPPLFAAAMALFGLMTIASLVDAHTQVAPFTGEVPRTNFSCKDLTPGYYADVDTQCQVYHMCDPRGRKYSYTCPNQTAFNQRMMVCDHFHLVNCNASKDYFFLNARIGNSTENLHQTLPPNCAHCRTSARRPWTGALTTKSGLNTIVTRPAGMSSGKNQAVTPTSATATDAESRLNAVSTSNKADNAASRLPLTTLGGNHLREGQQAPTPARQAVTPPHRQQLRVQQPQQRTTAPTKAPVHHGGLSASIRSLGSPPHVSNSLGTEAADGGDGWGLSSVWASTTTGRTLPGLSSTSLLASFFQSRPSTPAPFATETATTTTAPTGWDSTATSTTPEAEVTKESVEDNARPASAVIERRKSRVRRPFSVLKRKLTNLGDRKSVKEELFKGGGHPTTRWRSSPAAGVKRTPPVTLETTTSTAWTTTTATTLQPDLFFTLSTSQVPSTTLVEEAVGGTSMPNSATYFTSPTNNGIREQHGPTGNELLHSTPTVPQHETNDDDDKDRSPSFGTSATRSNDSESAGRMWAFLFNLMNSIDDVDESGMKNFRTEELLNIPWWILPKKDIPTNSVNNEIAVHRAGRKLVTPETDVEFVPRSFGITESFLSTSTATKKSTDPENGEGKVVSPRTFSSSLPSARTSKALNFDIKPSQLPAGGGDKTSTGALKFRSSTTTPHRARSQIVGEASVSAAYAKTAAQCPRCHPYFVRDVKTCSPCVKIRR